MNHLPFNGESVFRRENTFYKPQEYSENTKISGYITEKIFDSMGFKRISVDWSGVNLVVEILDLQKAELEVLHVLTVLDQRCRSVRCDVMYVMRCDRRFCYK